MLGDSGIAAVEDLTLLSVAVLSLSLFFSSLAASAADRSSELRGERLREIAQELLSAVRDGAAWTARPGVLLAPALDDLAAGTLAPFASGHPFRVTVWDLSTNRLWIYETGQTSGDQRTAASSANVVDERVDPARITATVWAT